MFDVRAAGAGDAVGEEVLDVVVCGSVGGGWGREGVFDVFGC